MNYKKSSLIFLTILIVSLVAIATFNYIVDPAGMFRTTKYEYGIAQILLKGENVANLSDYNERLVQKYFIQNINFKPKIIVLGSSRSLFIAPNNKEDFFNNSVSGASFEDMIAIYGIYNYKKITPKTILICLDPWLLNINNGQSRWQSIKNEYDYEASQLNIETNSTAFNSYELKKLQELVSIPYFLASINQLKHKKNFKEEEKNKYFETKENYLDVSVKRKDGTYAYPIDYRSVNLTQINQAARTYANTVPIYSLGDFTKLSNKDLFEALISDMLKKKIKVIFFLAPYHPYVYSVIKTNSKYHQVLEAEKYFVKFAKNNKIPLIGSYNPAKINLSEIDFYDGMHLKESAIKKMNVLGY